VGLRWTWAGAWVWRWSVIAGLPGLSRNVVRVVDVVVDPGVIIVGVVGVVNIIGSVARIVILADVIVAR